MNFRSPLASCGCGGSLAESLGLVLQLGFQGEKPEGSAGEEAAREARRYPPRKIAARGGAPIVLENCAAPSGKWPPAGGGSGCPRQGAQRERAEPGPASPGLRSPEARPGRGSSSPQSLLPPDGWPPASREHRAHGPQEPRPRPRVLGSGRRPGLSAPRGCASWVPAAACSRPVRETGAS